MVLWRRLSPPSVHDSCSFWWHEEWPSVLFVCRYSLVERNWTWTCREWMNESVCFTRIVCPLKWPKRTLLLKQLLLVWGFYPPVALRLCTSIFCKQRAEYDTALPLYSDELCGSNIFITTMLTAYWSPQQTSEETETFMVLPGESRDFIYLVSQAWKSFNLFYCNLEGLHMWHVFLALGSL